MNKLKEAFMNLAGAIRPAKKPRIVGKYHKPTPGTKKSGKTKPGAIHKQGRKFRSRFITTIKLKNGQRAYVTPAAYRHFRIANPERAKKDLLKAKKKFLFMMGIKTVDVQTIESIVNARNNGS